MRSSILLLLGTVLLGGCSAFDWLSPDSEKKLEGDRISVLEMQGAIEPDDAALKAQGFIAPVPWQNEFWPQAGGYPNHVMQHMALNEGALKKIWSVDIGDGSSEDLPLTAQPVVVDGKVFVIDSRHMLSAFSAIDGKKLWTVDIGKPKEDDQVIGGGISYSQGALYVTNGYDEAMALSPADGKTVWKVKISSPSRAAPTAVDGRVFITTLDNRLIALNAADGAQMWDYAGIGEVSGLVGAASPAAGQDVVVAGFSSGELIALHVENGAMAWSENLSAVRSLGGLGGLSDIRGFPVIDKGLVIAISFGGRMIAIDERTGERVWQRDIGGSETPWVAGNHVFVLSTENELVALGRDDGAIDWVAQLPRFEDPKDRDDPVFWTGPVLAGGRLFVGGSNGDLTEIDPSSGKILRVSNVGKSVLIPPLVAGGALYLLTEDGTLAAYR